jgi:uncharacterized caspase-like protein
MEIDLQTAVTGKASLLRQITELFQQPRTISLFYFSGHGLVTQLGGYLVTPDVKEYDEGIHMDTVVQLANASPALNKIIILDCCFAGAVGRGNLMAGMNIQVMEGLTILTASRHNEPAKMYGGKSLFTALLVQALSGGAADIRGRVTPASVYAYIDQTLGETGQRPVFKTNITRFVHLRTAKPPLSPEVLLKLTGYFDAPDDAFPLDSSFEYTNTAAYAPLKKKPYAKAKNVKAFKDLQQMQSVGLVVPQGAPFMYFAAMKGKSCKLTPLGKHYWRLVKENKI